MDRRGHNESLKNSAEWNNTPEMRLLQKWGLLPSMTISQKVWILRRDGDRQAQPVE
jgi:hypothetical protein